MELKDLKHLAKLSYLRLSDEELKRFATELTSILDYVSELNEVDTLRVPAIARAVKTQNVFRNDEQKQKPPPEQAAQLVNAAPDTENGYVKVKAVL